LKKRLTINQIDKINRLSATGVSLYNISRHLNLSKSTVYYHAKRYCRKMSLFNVDFLNDAEKGYVIGLFLGDGSFNKGHSNPRFFVRFAFDAKRDQDVISRLTHILGKAGKKVSVFPWKNNTIVKVCSKELVIYIQQNIKYIKGLNSKREKHLLVHSDWPADFKYGIIAGIIDSDGHVHKHLGTEIKTVSKQILDDLTTLFNDLNIPITTTVYEAPKSSFSKLPRYAIYIASPEIKQLCSSLPSVKIARYL